MSSSEKQSNILPIFLSIIMLVIVIFVTVVITSGVKDQNYKKEQALLKKYPPTGLTSNTASTPVKDVMPETESPPDIQEKDIPSTLLLSGNITWEGRYVEIQENDLYRDYHFQLVKIEDDTEETVYESEYGVLFDKNYFEVDKDALLFHADSGGPEGIAPTTIVFTDGDEVLRSSYSTFGPFVQNFYIQSPDSPKYFINLLVSKNCFDYNDRNKLEDGRSKITDELLDNEITDILGIELTTKDDYAEEFLLDTSLTVPCVLIDGSIHNPTLLHPDIKTSSSGVDVKITDNHYANIMMNEKTKKPEVKFY